MVSGLCYGRILWPLASYFCLQVTRNCNFCNWSHRLGTLDFTGSVSWAPSNFLRAQPWKPEKALGSKLQNCKFHRRTLISQKRLEHKEIQTKYRKMTRKPRIHIRMLIYQLWAIQQLKQTRHFLLHHLSLYFHILPVCYILLLINCISLSQGPRSKVKSGRADNWK